MFALLLALNTVAQRAQAQVKKASQSIPKLLKFNTVGAPMMSSYSIEWNGRELKTTQSSGAGADKKTLTRKPTEAEWQRFWRTMNAVRIWNWKSRYLNDHVTDGIFWQITIKRSGQSAKKCDVMGSNAYPSDANEQKPLLEFEPSRRYTRFVNALLALAGKVDFKESEMPLPPSGGGH
jgi:hypothetical protein